MGWLGFFIALTFALILMGVRPVPAFFLLAVFAGTWLFFTVFTRVVRAIVMGDDNTGPRGESVYGRLRGMTVGPDGAIYVGTSNRDGRGFARSGDDRILKLMPR